MKEAAQLYREAEEKCAKADILMKRAGVHMCSSHVLNNWDLPDGAVGSIQVYSGIRKLAKLFQTDAKNPVDSWSGKPKRDSLHCIVETVNFHQLGNAHTKETNYKFS